MPREIRLPYQDEKADLEFAVKYEAGEVTDSFGNTYLGTNKRYGELVLMVGSTA